MKVSDGKTLRDSLKDDELHIENAPGEVVRRDINRSFKICNMKIKALAKHLKVKLAHVPEHYKCEDEGKEIEK